jgi:hypothetical protein
VKYHYFVTYTCTINSGIASGNSAVVLREPIDCYEDIGEIGKYLEKRCKASKLVILNYILMRTEEESTQSSLKQDKSLFCKRNKTT